MKHKARLCAHGGMQKKWGVNYWETYSPVVNWISVRTVLAIATIHDLPSFSIDFVLAYPQADLDVPVYMELPIGFESPKGVPGDYFLSLNKSLYGLKQTAVICFECLKGGLDAHDFFQSNLDPCELYKEGMVVLVCLDYCIDISPRSGPS